MTVQVPGNLAIEPFGWTLSFGTIERDTAYETVSVAWLETDTEKAASLFAKMVRDHLRSDHRDAASALPEYAYAEHDGRWVRMRWGLGKGDGH
jgi:hypothetical protein